MQFEEMPLSNISATEVRICIFFVDFRKVLCNVVFGRIETLIWNSQNKYHFIRHYNLLPYHLEILSLTRLSYLLYTACHNALPHTIIVYEWLGIKQANIFPEQIANLLESYLITTEWTKSTHNQVFCWRIQLAIETSNQWLKSKSQTKVWKQH